MAATSENFYITTDAEPTLFEAMSSISEEREMWLAAIEDEFQSIASKQTWHMDDSQKDTSLPTHVVVQIRRDESGNLDYFKAWIVAGGDHQILGQNNMETYAPVDAITAMQLFLHLVLCQGFYIAQINIKTAFFNDVLTEDAWGTSPRGISGRSSRVY